MRKMTARRRRGGEWGEYKNRKCGETMNRNHWVRKWDMTGIKGRWLKYKHRGWHPPLDKEHNSTHPVSPITEEKASQPSFGTRVRISVVIHNLKSNNIAVQVDNAKRREIWTWSKADAWHQSKADAWHRTGWRRVLCYRPKDVKCCGLE